jgi:RNA polymerase sigma-70 factor (ECF subfamily)
MNDLPTGPTDSPATAGNFAPTQWSVVLAARPDSATRTPALERLCATYWLPVYGYIRRHGHAPSDAEDLTQGFFARLLEGNFLERPDPSKGRFRGYLIGALRNYLGDHFERLNTQKRGGGVRFLDWASLGAEREFNSPGHPQQDPAEAYDVSWAMVVFATALRRLEEEQAAAGKAALFAQLRGYLSASPSQGDYERTARKLGLTRSHVAVSVHRLNHRYRELIRLEIAATVQDPAEVKDEIRHLLRVLGK